MTSIRPDASSSPETQAERGPSPADARQQLRQALAPEASSQERPHGLPAGTLPISVVVPCLNAAHWVESCLRAIRANRPAEIILVNGPSTDATAELARPLVDRLIEARTSNVAQARAIGFAATKQEWVAFIDVDVVLPAGALAGLLAEAEARGLVGLQAGMHSVGARDYWSEALASHHNEGRSRHWFGLNATILRRDVAVRNPLDESFASGEDIEYRYRMRLANEPVGVSDSIIVEHRFGAGYAFAASQWLADGAGLGRLVRKYGLRAVPSALIPFAASAAGVVGSIGPQYRRIPYFVLFGLGNLVGLVRGLIDPNVSLGAVPAAPDGGEDDGLGLQQEDPGRHAAGSIAVRYALALMGIALGLAAALLVVLPGVAKTVVEEPLPAIVALGAVVAMIYVELGLATDRGVLHDRAARLAPPALVLALLAAVASAIRFAGILGLLH